MSLLELGPNWNAFHFLRPQALWLLLPAILAVLWAWRRSQVARAWAGVCDPELLAAQQLPGEHAGRAHLWLMLIAAWVLPLALAGPAWQQLPQPLMQSIAARVIALDLSRSMDAADLRPSRLDRARFRIRDLLKEEPDTRTALLVFSAQAHRVVPLTDDHDTIRHLLDSLGTELLPPAAARLAPALDEALALMQAGGALQGEVLLISDSRPEAAAREAARALTQAGYRLRIVGVGTAEGAPIPDQDGGWLKDEQGAIVLPGLDRAALKALAHDADGRYDDLEELRLVDHAWQRAAAEQDGDSDLRGDQWQDEGRWLILLLLPLAAMGARRGWLGALLLVTALAGTPPTLEAADWWQNENQRAHAQLEAGKADLAAERFIDPRWRAAALYEAGQFQEAANQFAELPSPDGADYYNLGNALARSGELEAALEAYDQALAQRPDWSQAGENRQLVEQLIREQAQQTAEPPAEDGETGDSAPEDGGGGSEESGEASDDGKPPAGESDESGQGADNAEPAEADAASAGDDPEQGAAPEQAEPDAAGNEQSSPPSASEAARESAGEESEAAMPAQALDDDRREADERAQAMEQWLRRIPDDPGGLLRRRFRWEQERREQQAGRSQTAAPTANEDQNW